MKNLVSVIIPTKDRSSSLLKCLNSLFKTAGPKEVVIIDNGSKDSTPAMVKKKFPKVKIIEKKSNIGFAPALNLGIKQTCGKYIFITNDDVIFDKNCLSELVKVADSDPKIAIVGGKMFFRNRPKIMALPGFRVNIWLGYHPYDFTGQDRVREMDVATGGCMLIKKSVFRKIGLFDEGFFFCGEDYDLCFRAKKAGFKVMFSPKAIVWHKFLNSGKKKQNFSQLFAHYRGKLRFMLIHATLPQLLVFLPIQFVVGPLISYYQSRQKTVLPMWTALFWNILNISPTLNARSKVKELSK